MCGLFINADADLWACTTRSMRIEGVVTSIRMENFFWGIMQEIAFRDDMTVNQLIARLYLESLDADHDVGNFTSFLRVCCGRYLSLSADGEIERDGTAPLADMASPSVLCRESEATGRRKLRITRAKSKGH